MFQKIKCNLYKEEKIELCNGDRIKWTKILKNPKDSIESKNTNKINSKSSR